MDYCVYSINSTAPTDQQTILHKSDECSLFLALYEWGYIYITAERLTFENRYVWLYTV